MGQGITDTPSGGSGKFSNFLSRQLLWRGLKRTKSVTKLDRARRSLGFAFNKEPVPSTSTTSPGRESVRSSRSHESLLAYSCTTHMLDLTEAQPSALHSSMVHAPNSFAMSTPPAKGRLRQAVFPEQNNIRRTENSLQLWLLEAKGVPSKKRYFCELSLDQRLCGRTSSKLKSDLCFWGEAFSFDHLSRLESVCVSLYREGDKKKNRDRATLIGIVQIPVSQLTSKQPVERWYSVVTGAGDRGSNPPSIRIKGRYQSLLILPMRNYQPFLTHLKANYLTLATVLEPHLGAKSKEDLATSLVHVLHQQKQAKDFLTDIVCQEARRVDNDHLLFRGNSLATKSMEAYMKLVGGQYLQDTLGDFVRSVAEAGEECEVDPVKVPSKYQLEKNQKTLTFLVEMAWGKIINASYFPVELRVVFSMIRARLGRRELADNVISSCIFLRFLCPAVLSPSLFGLTAEFPNEKCSRSLTLVAKTLQTLANFSQFGGKEQYMEFMNHFVDREWSNMRHFLGSISAPLDKDQRMVELEGMVDLGKELSLLHGYLTECCVALPEDGQASLGDLRSVLDNISDALRNPTTPILDPMITARSRRGGAFSPLSDYDNNHSGADEDSSAPSSPSDLTPRNGLVPRKTIAPHLGTSDDYVMYTALIDDEFPADVKRNSAQVDSGHRKRPPVPWFSPPEDAFGKIAINTVDVSPGDLSQDSGGPEADDEHRDLGNSPLLSTKNVVKICDKVGSHGSLASSSGYHSLPNSNSSSSSSPVDGTELTLAKAHKSTERKHEALAFSNPLYSLQTVPLLPHSPPDRPPASARPRYEPLESTSLNLSKSQTDLRPRPQASSSLVTLVPPKAPLDRANGVHHRGGSEPSFLASVPSPRGAPWNGPLVTKTNSSPPYLTNRSLSSLTPNSISSRRSHTPVSSTPPRRTSVGYARNPAPRTNPRFVPPAVSRSPQLRRTNTDSSIAQRPPVNVPTENYEGELEAVKQQLEQAKELLRESQQREQKWKEKFEKVALHERIDLNSLKSTDI